MKYLMIAVVLFFATIGAGCMAFKFMVKVQCSHQDFGNTKCIVYPRVSKEKPNEPGRT